MEANGVKTVVVEDASRFARDLVTQELGLLALIQRGVRVLTSNGDDLTDTSDPSRVMMRQIAGSFAHTRRRGWWRSSALLATASGQRRASARAARASWSAIPSWCAKRSFCTASHPRGTGGHCGRSRANSPRWATSTRADSRTPLQASDRCSVNRVKSIRIPLHEEIFARMGPSFARHLACAQPYTSKKSAKARARRFKGDGISVVAVSSHQHYKTVMEWGNCDLIFL